MTSLAWTTSVFLAFVFFCMTATGKKSLYSNTWVVQVHGGTQEADRVAKMHGFVNEGQVRRTIGGVMGSNSWILTRILVSLCCRIRLVALRISMHFDMILIQDDRGGMQKNELCVWLKTRRWVRVAEARTEFALDRKSDLFAVYTFTFARFYRSFGPNSKR